MTTFLITYDLATPARNRDAVVGRIMAAGDAWARPLAQTWYVRADCDAADVEAAIGDLLSDDDGLVVQAVSDDVVFANTALRWFRKRSLPSEIGRATPLADTSEDGLHDADVVAFPSPTDEHDLEDLAA